MERRTVGLITFGLLAALFLVTLTVPVGGAVGAVLFALVVVLVGVLYLRFGPGGDAWEAAERLAISPWLFVLLVLLFAAAFMAFRIGLLQSAM